MPRATKVVIVYSPGQALRRTVIIPDDDRQVPLHVRNVAPGEAVLVGSLGLYRLIGPDEMLRRVLGRKSVSDRCAVVDARGVVIGHIGADPAIDRNYRHGTLHHDPEGRTVVGQGYHHLDYRPPKSK